MYAFSIENFKRSEYEVNGLMEIARIRLLQLAQHGELLQRYGARVHFIGRPELFRKDVQEAVDSIMDLTKDNDR